MEQLYISHIFIIVRARHTVLLEELTVTQLVKKFTDRVHMAACQWTPVLTRLI